MTFQTGTSASDSRARCLVPSVGTALYVHTPFCVRKCTYCDFFSVRAEGQDIPGAVDALLNEAARRAPEEPRTVFIGGGTPSLLPEEELRRLFDNLDSFTGFRTSAVEVTVECNPESLTPEKAFLLRELGADRLSIGFQSLNPKVLELFGRVHSAEESFSAFEAARNSGFLRISVDMIYAAPNQTLETWLRELDRVLELRPEHISAYALAYEEGTVLTSRMRSGTIARLQEQEELLYFEETRGRLQTEGYEAYEISNFALDGERCRHNCNYWRNGDYVGIGPSAVSHLHGTRMGNPPSIEQWKRGIDRDGFAFTWEESLGPRQRLGETWWLGLRTADGVDPEEARRTAGWHEPQDPVAVLAAGLRDLGLLEVSGPRFRLSPRGLPLADAVSQRFLQACDNSHPSHGRPSPSTSIS